MLLLRMLFKRRVQHEINKFIKRNSTGDVPMVSTVHCDWLVEVQVHLASFFNPVVVHGPPCQCTYVSGWCCER